MKKGHSRTKRNKKKKRIRISAVTIWIGLELAAAAAMAVIVPFHMLRADDSVDTPTYSVPVSQVSNMTVDDIELPVDLMEDEAEVEGIAGDLYSVEYPEEIMELMSGMSAEQKADMLLVTTPESLCDTARVTIAGNIFKEAYSKHPVTGLIFTDDNFTSEAAGMNMLASLRQWSRSKTKFNILIGYQGNTTDLATVSGKGINLNCIKADDASAADSVSAAREAGMLSAYLINRDELPGEEDGGLYIIKANDEKEVIDLIKEGRSLLYFTGDHETVFNALLEAINDGSLPQAAVDKAVGYALTVRQTLTEMRPEESERKPPAPKATTRKSTTNTSNKKAAEQKGTDQKDADQKTANGNQIQKTPEQEAADAQKALQKQLEDMMKEAQKSVAAPGQ